MLAVPGQALYAGTEFAVVGLSTALDDEFSPQGVRVNCVMPTFTNTELISGTNARGATSPLEPEDIAAAVVRILDKPKTVVSVPYPLRFAATAIAFLPPRARRLVSKTMGTDRVFLDLDTAARVLRGTRREGQRAHRSDWRRIAPRRTTSRGCRVDRPSSGRADSRDTASS